MIHRNLYYKGWEISQEYCELNSQQINILDACVYMVEHSATLRETAEICDFSLTGLWRRIHNECSILSPGLYLRVKKQMKNNLQHPKHPKHRRK